MQCPECGLNDVANDDGVIKPHPRPDTLHLCTGQAQPESKPAPKKAAAKAAKPRTKR